MSGGVSEITPHVQTAYRVGEFAIDPAQGRDQQWKDRQVRHLGIADSRRRFRALPGPDAEVPLPYSLGRRTPSHPNFEMMSRSSPEYVGVRPGSGDLSLVEFRRLTSP